MKNRQGFVSNSSSSSFVIVGYKADAIAKTNKEKENLIKKYSPELVEKWETGEIGDAWYELMNGDLIKSCGVSYLSDDGPGYVGVIIADVGSDDGYLKNAEYGMEETIQKLNAFRSRFNIKEEPKIITGTRAC